MVVPASVWVDGVNLEHVDFGPRARGGFKGVLIHWSGEFVIRAVGGWW
jgi:hypothetical protein